MLEVSGLRIGYGQVEVVHGVSFNVKQGECVALIGPNGAGKSTILKTVCGLMSPLAGSIMLDGRSIAGLPGHTIAGLGISMCPEGRQVFRK